MSGDKNFVEVLNQARNLAEQSFIDLVRSSRELLPQVKTVSVTFYRLGYEDGDTPTTYMSFPDINVPSDYVRMRYNSQELTLEHSRILMDAFYPFMELDIELTAVLLCGESNEYQRCAMRVTSDGETITRQWVETE